MLESSPFDRDSENIPGIDHQDIFEQAPIGIFTTTPEGRYITANPALAKMFGYDSPEELITSVTDIAKQIYADPKEREVFVRMLETHGKVVNHECRFRRRDGTEFWVSRNVRTITNEDGHLIAYQGFTTDITERKLLEYKERESEQRFRLMFLNAPMPYQSLDEQGNFLEVNQTFLDVLGYSRDELIGRNFGDILHPDWRDHFKENFPRFKAVGEVLGVEFEMVKKGGSTILVFFNGKIQRDAQGGFERTHCIFQDITERRLIEDALRESEARFRNLLEQIPTVAVQGYGMDGVTHYWNKASQKIYGYSSEEAIGRNLVDLIIPVEMRDEVVAAMQSMAETGTSIPAMELNLRRKDGTRVLVYSSHAIVRRKDGEPELFCIDVDLTELKQAEQTLLQAKRQAEMASKAKSEFLANMSHEIRTPINGVMGMLQLLETTTLDADQRNYVHLCTSSADRLTRLLSDILDLSRIEAGMMSILEAKFELSDLIESVTGLFTAVAKKKNIDLKCEIEPSIPKKLIGDEARMRQILFNLVGNALKFTDKGFVKICINSLSPTKGCDIRLMLSITDTGIGIPEDKLGILFNPFIQIKSSTTRNFQGAGLGLAIIKRLVDLMGGNISVESDVGQGTSVHVMLPLKLPETLKSDPNKGNPIQPHPDRTLHILLAEDDPSNALPIRKLLEKAGHTVDLAEDGKQVLNLLARQAFDVILMDVQMPVMDGVKTTRAIRASSDLGTQKDIPIIALTAYAMLGDREKFLEAGMNDYLAKPVKFADLVQILEKNIVR